MTSCHIRKNYTLLIVALLAGTSYFQLTTFFPIAFPSSSEIRLQNHPLKQFREKGNTFDVLRYYTPLYERYGHDLMRVIESMKVFCAQFRCLSDELEMELSYLRLRESSPNLVWEISSHEGYSTRWILMALRDNGHGKLISFDIIDNALHSIQADDDLIKNGTWQFVHGDVRQTLKGMNNLPDYLYLDALHTYEFGNFLATGVLSRFRSHVFVSLHDVFNPQFWSDAHNFRNLSLYPPWMANEEGQIVLQWLSFQQHQCNLHTIASPVDVNIYEAVKAMRVKSIGAIGVYSSFPESRAMEPTIYFELNCDG